MGFGFNSNIEFENKNQFRIQIWKQNINPNSNLKTKIKHINNQNLTEPTIYQPQCKLELIPNPNPNFLNHIAIRM